MAALDMNILEKLSKYIEVLTTNGLKTLDQNVMKKLKNICRKSDEYVKQAYQFLMCQLEKDHSEIRYSCVLVINELFCRSNQFRELVISDFQTFMELTVETDPEDPLPPPKVTAQLLKRDTLKMIQQWNTTYGEAYKKLALGYNFLKTCKMVDFRDIETRSEVDRQREQEEERKKEIQIQYQIDKAVKEMNESQVEIVDGLNQFENCLRLLSPSTLFTEMDFEASVPPIPPSSAETFDQDTSADRELKTDREDSDCEATIEGDSSLRDHGIFASRSFNLDLEIPSTSKQLDSNADNSIVIENLQDLYSLLKKKFIPNVTRWIKTFSKSTTASDYLKKMLDMKRALTSAEQRYDELKLNKKKFDPAADSDEDDDDFEEVEEKEGFEEFAKTPVVSSPEKKKPTSTVTSATATRLDEFKSTPAHWSLGSLSTVEANVTDPTTRVANVAALVKKLSDQIGDVESLPSTSTSGEDVGDEKKILKPDVPVVRYDVDLIDWENDKIEAPTLIRYETDHRFWQPVSKGTEEIIRPEDVANLRTRVIDFSGTFDPVKWECRAPMPSGRLCPRKDRVKCPLHGAIVPRDAAGQPTNPEDRMRIQEEEERKQRENPDWQDPALLADIEAATGVDLKMPKKRGKGKKKKKGPYPGLTEVKERKTARTRLEKKVFNKSSVKKVSSIMDNLDHKRFKDKFGDQFNYMY